MSPTKKLILIVVVLVLVAVALYFIFRAKPAPEEPTPVLFPRAETALSGRAPIKSQDQIEKEKLELEKLLEAGSALVETPFDATAGQLPQASLVKLLPDATAGATIISSTTPVVRYIRADNGHVWDMSLDGLFENRTSNITIPFIYKVRWNSNGQRAVVAFEDQNKIQIYSMDLTGKEPGGAFLNPTAIDFVFSTAQEILQLVPSGENLNVVRSSANGSGGRAVLTLPSKDFGAQWPSSAAIALTTKAAASAEGFAYIYNSASGVLEKIVGDIKGLSSLWSPDAKRLVYSSTNERDGSIDLFSADRSNPANARRISARTISEKCAWSKKDADIIYCGVPRSMPIGLYPDAWWQGLVSFQDDIVKINTATGEITKLLNTVSDAVDLTPAKDDEFLLFRDKKDGSLWTATLQ